MSAVAIELDGNFCHCTGYHNLVKADTVGAQAMRMAAGTSQKAAE